jgi:hypothetical protein
MLKNRALQGCTVADKLTYGVVDEPNPESSEDLLGLEKYSTALSTFIADTNTPMTIGIQGEWGSGKTSLIHSIQSSLNKRGDVYKQIWINAWEHCLLIDPEVALLNISTEIIDKMLSADEGRNRKEKVKEIAKQVFQGALKATATATLGKNAGEATSKILSSSNSSIKELRENLQRAAKEVCDLNTNRTERFVIYVDDLDRVDPETAVRVLELLKNIFSIPKCVFVLAIDYQVVIKGLESKYGKRTEDNDWEFRAFFDKIIQLPFMMPTSQYDTSRYIDGLLKQIKFAIKHDLDTAFLQKILDATIGSNPRSLKRLANSLALIQIFIESEKEISGDEFDRHDYTILFSLVCLQVKYPKIYYYVNNKTDFKNWKDEDFGLDEDSIRESEPKFSGAFELAKEKILKESWQQTLFKICYSNQNYRGDFDKILTYFNVLNVYFKQSKIKKSYSDIIYKIISYSSVTNVSQDNYQAENKSRDYTKYLFNGIKHSKAKLVLSVIKYYVAQNGDIDFADLKLIFPDINTKPTFVRYDEALLIFKEKKYKRHYLDVSDRITLKDSIICISNQWSLESISQFIDNARKAGILISKAV